MHRWNRLSENRGFTLVEMAVAVAISSFVILLLPSGINTVLLAFRSHEHIHNDLTLGRKLLAQIEREFDLAASISGVDDGYLEFRVRTESVVPSVEEQITYTTQCRPLPPEVQLGAASRARLRQQSVSICPSTYICNDNESAFIQRVHYPDRQNLNNSRVYRGGLGSARRRGKNFVFGQSLCVVHDSDTNAYTVTLIHQIYRDEDTVAVKVDRKNILERVDVMDSYLQFVK